MRRSERTCNDHFCRRITLCPVRSAARSEAKPNGVVRCRHGTAKSSELWAVPDQQCITERDATNQISTGFQALRAALHSGHNASGAAMTDARLALDEMPEASHASRKWAVYGGRLALAAALILAWDYGARTLGRLFFAPPLD